MMKLNTVLVLSVFITVLAIPMVGAYEIDGDTVTFEDSRVYFSATPHTIYSDGWVTMEFRSKLYTGDVDVAFGFDTDSSRPLAMERWTGSEWVDFGSEYDVINYEHDNKDRWYLLKNKPVVAGNTYTVRVWVDINEFLDGKYDFAIKPSGETLAQAIANDHFYILDPWFNSSWGLETDIIITNTGSELTNQTIFLELPKNDSMASNCSDVRFTNSDYEEIPYYIDSCNTTGLNVYVKPDTIIATGNTTIKMYFDNPDATETTQSGTDTFLYFDDFEDGDLSEYTLEDTPAIATNPCFKGDYCLFIDDSSVNQFAFITSSNITADKVIVAYVRQDNDSTQTPYPGVLFASNSSLNSYWMRYNADYSSGLDRISLRKTIGGSSSSPSDYTGGDYVPIQEYYKTVTTWLINGSIYGEYYQTDNNYGDGIYSYVETQLYYGRVGVGGYRYSHIDDWFVYDYYENITYYVGNTSYYVPEEPEIIYNYTCPDNLFECDDGWTSATCIDNYTLRLENNCSIEWMEGIDTYVCQTVKTKDVNCYYGCGQGINSYGDECYPAPIISMSSAFIIIMIFIILIFGIPRLFKKRRR